MIKIAHLSDLHLEYLKHLSPLDFLNKRITGVLNLLWRRTIHLPEVLIQAMEKIQGLKCNHLVITGDLTNLSLEGEFKNARQWLERFDFTPQRLSVVPGNHDCYTPSARHRFEYWFQDYMSSDLPEMSNAYGWPWIRLREKIALIGLNSAHPLPPLLSGGWIGKAQLHRLQVLLRHPQVKDRFKILLLHHSLDPDPHSVIHLSRALWDSASLKEVILQGGVQLVLHGHHHSYHQYLLDREKNIWVSEAGSTTVSRYRSEHRAGKFIVYEIQDAQLIGWKTYRFEPGQGFQLWKSVSL